MPHLLPVPVRLPYVLFLLATTSVFAVPAGVAAPAVVDGEPTTAACGQLGFDTTGSRTDGVGRRAYGTIAPLAGLAAPAPMPSTSAASRAYIPKLAQESVASLDTERYPDATPNPVKQVAADPVSTFSIDVDTASYANMRRFLNEGHLPPRDAVRVEELVNYFDYGYTRPDSASNPFNVQVAVVPSPWASGKEIIHIGLQGYDIARAAQPPLNLVFLMDVSGSMDAPDKLPLVQKALNILIDQLRAEDEVSLAVYAGAAGAVLPPTSGNEKLKLRCAVNALHAGGSTAGGEGLALAYGMAAQSFDKEAVNRVVLMTDGDFNVGVADPQKLEDFVSEKRKTGIYLSVYGVGRGNYNDLMMQTLSQSGNGTAAYIDTLQEARRLFRDDFSGSLFPIADDVKVQIEFNPATVTEYRLIGYETRLLDDADFNNDQVDAGEVGSGASVTALYEITPVGGPVAIDPLRYQNAPKPDGKAGELGYLKIRYKLPGKADSALIERPITTADRPAALAEAPESTRWAVAVAAYGQRLRGDAWMAGGYGWESILDLAQGARGDDPYGLRAEFVQLVRAAGTATSVNE